jgi:hypothetical protein
MQDAYGTLFDRHDTPFDRYDTPVDGDEAAVDRIEAKLDGLDRTMRRWMIVLMVWSAAWMAFMVDVTRGGR